MDFQSMNDEQLAELAAQYREGGGDEAALRDALDANALDTLTGDDDGNLG